MILWKGSTFVGAKGGNCAEPMLVEHPRRWLYFLFRQMLPQHTPTNTLRAPCHTDDICCHNTRLPNKVQKYPLSTTKWAQSWSERRPWGFSSRPQNSLAVGGDIPAASENKQCTRTEESLTQTFGSHLSWSSYPEKPLWLPASGHARKTPGTWTVLCLSPFFLSLSLSLTSIHL